MAKRGITECGVVAVALTSVRDSVGVSKGSSAAYGFVGIADWVRMGRGFGLVAGADCRVTG